MTARLKRLHHRHSCLEQLFSLTVFMRDKHNFSVHFLITRKHDILIGVVNGKFEMARSAFFFFLRV